MGIPDQQRIRVELSTQQTKEIEKLLQLFNNIPEEQLDVLLQILLQRRDEKGSRKGKHKSKPDSYARRAQAEEPTTGSKPHVGQVVIPSDVPIFIKLLVVKPHSIEVVSTPFNIMVEDFIAQLVEVLGLPLKTPKGYRYTYFLVMHNQSGERFILEFGKTLYEAGIVPGCDVSIIPELSIEFI